MTLKSWLSWRTLVLGCLVVLRSSEGGVVSLENEPDHHHHHQHRHHSPHNGYHHDHEEHVSVASSFMHFHGPVEGPEFEVKVPYVVHHHTSEHNHLVHEGEGENHEGAEEGAEQHGFHQGYSLDYVAHPKYQFSYGVEDHHTGDFHGQKETRDGSSVSGEYSIKEPGGGVRVVTYRADKDGFHAVVHTSGKNDHSGATYNPDAGQQHQGHHHVHQELQAQDQGHEDGVPSEHELHGYAPAYSNHEGYE